MSGENLAARLHGAGDVRVAPEAVVPPGPGEVTMQVRAVGLCGSDLHWYAEGSIGDAALDEPLIIGHEFSGVIADGPRSGERVVADPFDPCERCEPCRAGRSNVCTGSTRFAGFVGTDGALRSTMPWPGHLLHTIPDTIGMDEAALLETLGIALHALDLGAVPDGGRVGVYGCGPIGLLLVQLARRSGASVVVATDRLAHRTAAACAMGATDGFVVPEPGPELVLEEDGRHRIVDVAFEVAGDDDALADAIAAVRPGGRVVLVGIPDGDRSTFRAAAARRKELTLQLSRRMLPADLTRAIGLVASGEIDLSGLISHRFPIAEAGQAFAVAASRRGLKVVVDPSAIAGTAD